MSLADELPYAEPCDESRGADRRRRMPGATPYRRVPKASPERAIDRAFGDLNLPRLPAPPGAPRGIDDLPAHLRKPLRPPPSRRPSTP